MNESRQQQPRTCHYFVAEAGDGMLFNKRKRIVVGREGCSCCFMLGALEVDDPMRLGKDLESLRSKLRADPYLAKVASMQPERQKTAVAFHAKNDCAEVRREVYRLLMEHDMRFFAIVRHKRTIVEKVLEHNKKRPTYRYHPNQLYDRCVSRLFRDRLHKEDAYVIRFSKRGNRPRSKALENAIEQAKNGLNGFRMPTLRPRPSWRVAFRRSTISSGPCSGYTSEEKIATGNTSPRRSAWCMTSTTHERASTERTTRRGIRSRWKSAKK